MSEYQEPIINKCQKMIEGEHFCFRNDNFVVQLKESEVYVHLSFYAFSFLYTLYPETINILT